MLIAFQAPSSHLLVGKDCICSPWLAQDQAAHGITAGVLDLDRLRHLGELAVQLYLPAHRLKLDFRSSLVRSESQASHY